MPTTTLAPIDTKTALLDAAEGLFAELGIAGASMRALTGRRPVAKPVVDSQGDSTSGPI